ncbi:MAG TPA: helix-hairpin-helix domain-containing protein [Tepidisphaeraceae bacterium]|nr:helix-hairpin-helix domain-containing protein [Tepidisphaeraceae bacterium]
MKLWRGWSVPQRGVLIALLCLMFICLAVRLIVNPQYISDPQPIEPSRARELENRIDPNVADAPTLSVLPLIGEKRAQDIVAYREKFVASHPRQRAYVRPEDLTVIRGIGTATLQQMEPFLIFDRTATTQIAR